MFSTMRSAALLVLLASCATALHAPATIHSANAKAPAAPALRSNALRLKGGGPIKAPPTEVVNWVPDLSKHGPIKHILAINFIGATLLGIFTSGKIPAKLVPVLVTASRIVSAIVTIDAFNIYTAGKETEALMYFLLVVPFNLIGNRFGRGFAEKHL